MMDPNHRPENITTVAEREAYLQGAKDALKWVTETARSRYYKQPSLAEFGVSVKMLQDSIERGEWPKGE